MVVIDTKVVCEMHRGMKARHSMLDGIFTYILATSVTVTSTEHIFILLKMNQILLS